jgi:hypothetical protein
LRQEIILFFSTHPLTPLPPRQLSQTQNDWLVSPRRPSIWQQFDSRHGKFSY